MGQATGCGTYGEKIGCMEMWKGGGGGGLEWAP